MGVQVVFMSDSDPQDTNQPMPSNIPPTTADPVVPPSDTSNTPPPPPITETAVSPSMDYSSSSQPATESVAVKTDMANAPPPPSATEPPPPPSDISGTPPPPEEKKDRKKLWLILATLI